jgi:TRAP-type C4-dicarboxylate transport system permease small subunit
LESLVKGLRLLEAIIATAAYAAVAGLLMADVIGRELFQTSFLGAQQLAVYGAIIAGFLGLTLATSDNAHLRPEFMDFALRRLDRTAIRIGDFMSALFFFAACYIAWTFVEVSMEAKDRAPVLYFVVWPLQLVIPYAFASSGLKHLVFALRPDVKPAPAEKV